VDALKAVGEPSRLRIVSVLARIELTVGELCRVIGQSQPRTSRHLRLLCDAGVLERHAEGTSAFYRPAATGLGRDLLDVVKTLIDDAHPAIARDLERLSAVREDRAAEAEAYFSRIATNWDQIRFRHVADEDVEAALLEAVQSQRIGNLLDIGTGTGRILEVFADRIDRGLGIDQSRPMLNVARANLDAEGLSHCRVRHADVYDLDLPAGSFDVAVLHHVLHFLDDPADAIAQTARTLKPGGRMLVVDYQLHHFEFLRSDYAHRRLGFDDDEVNSWFQDADLDRESISYLNGPKAGPDSLTTVLWTAVRWPSLATTAPIGTESNSSPANNFEVAS